MILIIAGEQSKDFQRHILQNKMKKPGTVHHTVPGFFKREVRK